jgi:hypothetical protein
MFLSYKDEIFDLLFEVAEINKLTTEDMKTYKKALLDTMMLS